MKYRAMTKNPFVFLRGTCRLFYERVGAGGFVPSGPRAWLCGDLHLENYGTFVTGDGVGGSIVFDVNDFDEAVLAPYGLDILRLATSVLIGAETIGLSTSQAREVVHRLIAHYLAELSSGRPRTLDGFSAKGPVRALIEDLRNRSPKKFLAKRVKEAGGRPMLITDGDKALPLGPEAKSQIAAIFEKLPPPQGLPRAFAFLDAARRIAGTGSLGIPRDVVLTEGQAPTGPPWLIDIKAAGPSALLGIAGPQPAFPSEAVRVVDVQQRFQADPPALLQAVTIGGTVWIFKQLQPSADRLDLEAVARDRDALNDVVDAMAHLAAWGHLRAAGHLGAATVAELATAANASGVGEDMDKRAVEMAAITHSDFASYAAAFAAGQFVVK